MGRRRRDREQALQSDARKSDAGPPTTLKRAPEALAFSTWTGVFGGAGLVTVLLGFYLLIQGSLALAPVLLVIGFLVFFPIALVK